MILPIVRVIEGDGDEQPSLPLHGGDQTTACFFGVSGLDAPHLVGGKEQFVVVFHLPPGGGSIFLPHDLGKILVFHCRGSQPGQIPGSGVMPFPIQPAGAGKMGVMEPQNCRPLIHLPDKSLFAARCQAGQRHCPIVAAEQQQAIQQLPGGQALPCL